MTVDHEQVVNATNVQLHHMLSNESCDHNITDALS